MKKIILLILFFSITVAYGQTKKLDSLKLIIKTTKIDTTRVWTLIALGNEIEASKPDEAYKYYKEAESISRKVNFHQGTVKSIANFCFILNNKAKYDESYIYTKEAIKISHENNLGILEAKSINNMGNWYFFKGDFNKSLEYYLKATDLADKNNYSDMYLKLRMNVGNIYKEMGKFKESKMVCDEVYTLAKKKGDLKMMSQAQITKGNCFIQDKKYKEAILPYEEALSLTEKLDDKFGIIISLNNLTNAYEQTHQAEKAFNTARKVIPIASAYGDQEGIRVSYHTLGNYYFNKIQKDSAEKYYENSLNLALKLGVKHELYKNYWALAKAKLLKGNVKDWEKYSSISDSLKDLTIGEKVQNNSNELEVKYNLGKKQNQILQQDIQIQKNKNNIWLLAGGFLILSILGLGGFYTFRKNQINKNLEAKLDSQNAERQRISREMHDDLGGNLTSLIYLSHSLKTQYPDNSQIKKLGNTSLEISETLNEIVWSLNSNQNKLADWVQYTKGRLSEFLESSDLNYKFNISSQIPDRILNDDEKRNLYLVCKEAINNVLKHAQAKNVLINMDFSNGIKINIKDDGSGFNETTKTKTGSGNGISNMIARMEQIGGSIEWENLDGTEVKISLS